MRGRKLVRRKLRLVRISLTAPGDALRSVCAVGVKADLAPLAERIGPAAPEIIEIFTGSGATEISDHDLTPAERDVLDRALERLPDLHRHVLRGHLRRLSFLGLAPGSGSALTSRVEGADELFDITLRASLLDEAMSEETAAVCLAAVCRRVSWCCSWL